MGLLNQLQFLPEIMNLKGLEAKSGFINDDKPGPMESGHPAREQVPDSHWVIGR
jgi:hypothetical protein